MEDKKLTPQESMSLIAQMIETTKHRVAMPNLKISVMWAVLTILCAAIVLIAGLTCYSPWINLVWLALPIIGLPVHVVMAKKTGLAMGAKTAIDNISDKIWKSVAFVALALSIICLVFNLFGHPEVWLVMFYFAFIIVGFGAAMQGIILKENSYIFGGIFSIIVGFIIVALNICMIPLLMVWVLPLYMLCFLLMFIVPAFVIRKKLNATKQ